MKNNLKKNIFVVILLIIFLLVMIIKEKDNEIIPDNYMAIFYGEDGEYIYETYIYKIDNDHANRGFEYINVTKTIDTKENSKYKINEKGKVEWTDDVFVIAKKHNSYSYVMLSNDNRKYTIEEFQVMFMMN